MKVFIVERRDNDWGGDPPYWDTVAVFDTKLHAKQFINENSKNGPFSVHEWEVRKK